MSSNTPRPSKINQAANVAFFQFQHQLQLQSDKLNELLLSTLSAKASLSRHLLIPKSTTAHFGIVTYGAYCCAYTLKDYLSILEITFAPIERSQMVQLKSDLKFLLQVKSIATTHNTKLVWSEFCNSQMRFKDSRTLAAYCLKELMTRANTTTQESLQITPKGEQPHV